MYWFYFIDSVGDRHQINYQLQEYNNLMELIRDQSFEDWGDCRGRAWCGTCHMKTTVPHALPSPDDEEKACLHQLSNTTANSRLACQIFLDKRMHQMEFKFIGGD